MEPGVSSAEVEAESERAQLKLPLKQPRKHPGRQELPAHLPRIEKIIACTPQQCVCGQCGKENSVIGYEKSEQLDVKPAEYFVVATKREKRACKDCEEQGVECAPVPVRIIEKGGQSSGRYRYGGQQICRSRAALSAKCDFGEGDRHRAVPSDFEWLGDAGGRVAATDHCSDGSGIIERHLSPGR